MGGPALSYSQTPPTLPPAPRGLLSFRPAPRAGSRSDGARGPYEPCGVVQTMGLMPSAKADRVGPGATADVDLPFQGLPQPGVQAHGSRKARSPTQMA